MSNLERLPNDPVMLLSYVNLKLRDEFPTLSDFCQSSAIDKTTLIKKLKTIDYTYNETANQFQSYV